MSHELFLFRKKNKQQIARAKSRIMPFHSPRQQEAEEIKVLQGDNDLSLESLEIIIKLL